MCEWPTPSCMYACMCQSPACVCIRIQCVHVTLSYVCVTESIVCVLVCVWVYQFRLEFRSLVAYGVKLFHSLVVFVWWLQKVNVMDEIDLPQRALRMQQLLKMFVRETPMVFGAVLTTCWGVLQLDALQFLNQTVMQLLRKLPMVGLSWLWQWCWGTR